MIVSLLRPTNVYCYDNHATCLPIYKYRTLQSIGVETKPIKAINAETVAKTITTLIHNEQDPNMYFVMNNEGMYQYLTNNEITFDTPEQPPKKKQMNQYNDMNYNVNIWNYIIVWYCYYYCFIVVIVCYNLSPLH